MTQQRKIRFIEPRGRHARPLNAWIKRWPLLGGMGTAALVNIWHLSDRQKIVIRGFAEEAVHRAERRN